MKYNIHQGKPKGTLPDLSERRANYDLVKASKYSTEADLAGGGK